MTDTITHMITAIMTARGNMPDPFLIRAALAGLGVAAAAGPLGCFVVWRRMAYFGDATSHAAILGVALSLALTLPVQAGILLVALLAALAVSTLAARGWALDTTLGVIAHSALAFGLVAVSFLPVRVSLDAYLFGDILAVSWGDVATIWIGAALTLALIGLRWNALVLTTLSGDLAVASGIRPDRERLVLTIALALVVALAIKVVGALLIAAMLLIPAATARGIARTPESAALTAVAAGAVATLAGLWASFRLDTPAGPSIVTAATLIFAATALIRRKA